MLDESCHGRNTRRDSRRWSLSGRLHYYRKLRSHESVTKDGKVSPLTKSCYQYWYLLVVDGSCKLTIIPHGNRLRGCTPDSDCTFTLQKERSPLDYSNCKKLIPDSKFRSSGTWKILLPTFVHHTFEEHFTKKRIFSTNKRKDIFLSLFEQRTTGFVILSSRIYSGTRDYRKDSCNYYPSLVGHKNWSCEN